MFYMLAAFIDLCPFGALLNSLQVFMLSCYSISPQTSRPVLTHPSALWWNSIIRKRDVNASRQATEAHHKEIARHVREAWLD
jgi:hypothetical protein